MARIRSVKPEFWTSEQTMSMSRDARLLFVGMWTFCDDNGIHPASALSLKAEVLPGDVLTADEVMTFVDEMIEQGLVEEYEVDGRLFWRVTGWHRHQRIDQPTFRHPKGDALGDAPSPSDTGDASGDRVTKIQGKRLGGKQRQIVLRKLRERDGDACHLCGSSSCLSIQSVAAGGEESANNVNDLRLICSVCKRSKKQPSAMVTHSDTSCDATVTCSDSATEWSGVESIGGDNKPKASPKPPVGGLGRPDVKSKDTGTCLQTFLDLCKANGERPIKEYEPVWTYAAQAKLPDDFVALAWVEFCRRFMAGGARASKRQKNWRQTFRNYVENNYLKLWAIDPKGEYFLTAQGKQAQKVHEAREAA